MWHGPVGLLRCVQVDHLDEEYVGPQDIGVLDRVPDDISMVMGLITHQFQAPLSHVNVLSQNRVTPNMGLDDATANPRLSESPHRRHLPFRSPLRPVLELLAVAAYDYGVPGITISHPQNTEITVPRVGAPLIPQHVG